MRECPKCELCFNEDVLFCPHDSSETRSTLPGPTLLAGRYLIEKRLGRGAMGQVYLARDENLGTRKVAVKTVRQDFLNSESLQEGEAIARFEREARSAASIRHPNVVDVTDFGKTGEGVFYLVMEYVEGETLHKLLRREGTLTIRRALHLLKQIAAGVEAAHEAGILHRDLKPANIFLMYTKKRSGESTEDGFLKVGDFGLAKLMNQTAADASSESGPSSRGIVGTPEFMAPEQMQYEAQLDARADIYALGTIAYLMLGGKTPFSGDLPQLVAQKLMDKPALLSAIRSDIPFAVEKIVMKALETEPASRPESVSDWVGEFEQAVDSSSQKPESGTARLVIIAPVGAEVYIDDERRGSIGSSGRLVLSTIPAGRHIMRVCQPGAKDDERVIEIREGSSEQVIQANLKRAGTPSHPSTSHGSGNMGYPSSLPDIVSCVKCNARFAAGVRFCGRCGGNQFVKIQPSFSANAGIACPRCGVKLPPFSKFCGRCGFKMNATQGSLQPRGFAQTTQSPPQNAPRRVEIFCVKCGTSYPAGTKFCGRCGVTLH
jgi:serine/threonine protein kinase